MLRSSIFKSIARDLGFLVLRASDVVKSLNNEASLRHTNTVDLCYDPLMPTEHILALLTEERDKLNRAIEALQGPAKRRGRPKGTGGGPSKAASGRKRGGTMSTEARAAQSERMKAYWAKRRKQAGKKP